MDSFYAYYEKIFGPRWEKLYNALLTEPHYHTLGAPLLRPYYLDKASLIAASTLPLSPGDKILDMCAAPGGKTLVLAARLPPSARLVANEKSRSRRARLHCVLKDHLPDELRERVQITGHDALRWCLYEPEGFEKILLDVPCSSERHIAGSPKYRKNWSPARTKHLAAQAYAMISSAFLVLKPGGILLYSTCALSPLENDSVVDKLLRRRKGHINVLNAESTQGEKTDFGLHILPDAAGSMGPIYFSLLEKKG